MLFLPPRRTLLALAAVVCLFSVAAFAVGVVRHDRFKVTVSKRAKTTAPGGAVKYALRVNRTKRTRGAVHMKVRGIPAGVRVQWRRQGRVVDNVMRHGGRKIRLRVITSSTTPVGRYRLRVTARHKHRRAHRRLILRVKTTSPTSLGVSGTLAGPLFPGRIVPLDVTVTNPSHDAIHLDGLTVSVVDRTSRPACDGSDNFGVVQMPPASVSLPPGATKLSATLPATLWPQVTMYDLPVNQDACKGTALTLSLQAVGRK